MLEVGDGDVDNVQDAKDCCESESDQDVEAVAKELVIFHKELIPKWEYSDPLKWQNHQIEWWLSAHNSSVLVVVLHCREESDNYLVVESQRLVFIVCKSCRQQSDDQVEEKHKID